MPSWFLFRGGLGGDGPVGRRLLEAALFYAMAMGWQPLLAVLIVRRWVEPVGSRSCGLRASRRRFLVVGVLAPLVLALVAFGLETALGPSSGAWFPEAASLAPGRGDGGVLALATTGLVLAGTLSLLWAQTMAEEIGWRGYLLPRLMGRFGTWSGLVGHGVLWGLWYAPILLMATGDPVGSWPRAASFVLTCAFLGTLLGWLRLASRSIVPPAAFNLALTLFAGLPFLVGGVDVGPRGAILGPSGWLPMAITLGILVAGPCRRALDRPVESRNRLRSFAA